MHDIQKHVHEICAILPIENVCMNCYTCIKQSGNGLQSPLGRSIEIAKKNKKILDIDECLWYGNTNIDKRL